MAVPPASQSGTVFEGDRVPGVALGDSRATVELRNGDGQPAGAALARATWRHPDGREESTVDVSSLSGYAHFATSGDRRGTYLIRIDSVELEDHTFDADGSVLAASVDIR